MTTSTGAQQDLPSAMVVDPLGEVSLEDLASDAFGLRLQVPRGAVVSLRADAARTVAAALSALDGWADRVELRPASWTDESDAVVVGDSACRSRVTGSPGPGDGSTTWRLFTSGTTGEPKQVDHTLTSLRRTARRSSTPARRWGLLYAPVRMAGIQVVLQALTSEETLVDASGLPSLPDRLGFLVHHRVNALSATPTLWRQVLQSGRAADLVLQQITLGGEIADQLVLDALSRSFPTAHITHVFASTETSAAFAVGDGRAGFPLSYLTQPPRGVAITVRQDELFVYAPETSASGSDGYVPTGDLVAVEGDRVLFRGRASGVVNVGGVKVSPEQVEDVLRRDPDVLDAVVRARRNAFSGQILVAEVVPTPLVDEKELSARLRASVGDELTSAHVPALVRVVPAIAMTTTGKAGR